MLLFYRATYYSLSLFWQTSKKWAYCRWIFLKPIYEFCLVEVMIVRRKCWSIDSALWLPFRPSLNVYSKVRIFYIFNQEKGKFHFRWSFSCFFLRADLLSEKEYVYERLKFTWMVLRQCIVNCKSKLLHSSLRIEMGLCGLSGGRKLQTTLQTGILIVCCTVMFFCSCCLAFSVSGECGEVLLLFRYH